MAHAHTTETPADADIDNGAAITVGNTFTVASNRSIYAIRFYAPTTVGGTYAVGLWEVTDDDATGTGTGTLLASVTGIAAAGITAGAWNRINLSAPASVTTGKFYRAGRWASNGRFVRTAGALGSAGISANGITIVQSGTPAFDDVVRNGTFNEGGALAYPASVFGSPDYFVEPDDESDAPAPVDGALAATTTSPAGALTAQQTFTAVLAATTSAPTAALAGTVPTVAALGATTDSPAGALTALVVNPAPATFPATGLLDLMRENRELAAAERARPPADCPNCGWPLDWRGGIANCPNGDYRSR